MNFSNFMKYIIPVILCLACRFSLFAEPTFDFSNEKQLQDWEVESGNITLSSRHTLDGKKSLRWDYDPESVLLLEKDIPYKKNRKMFFSAWVLAENNKQHFRFEFLKSGQLCSWFNYYSSKSGWQHIEVSFEHKMKGTALEGIDGLRIIAPKAKGVIYIACMTTAFQGSKDDLETSIAKIDSPVNNKTFAPLTFPNDPEFIGIKNIRKRLEKYAVKPQVQLSPVKQQVELEQLEEFYNNLKLTKKQGIINGPLVKNTRPYSQMLLRMALLYRNSNNLQLRAKLRKWAMMMAEYALRFPAIPSAGYNGEGFAQACFLWRKELKAAKLLDKMVEHLKRNYIFNRFYDRSERKGFTLVRGADSEYIANSFVSVLFMILMIDNSAQQVRDLKAFSSWMSQNAFNWAPGLSDGFKPDGTVFYQGVYSDYIGMKAVYMAARFIYFLHGTPYAISPEAHKRVRKFMIRQAFLTQGNTLPGMAFAANDAAEISRWAPYEFLYMALGGTIDRKQLVEPEMASLFILKFAVWEKNQQGKREDAEAEFADIKADTFKKQFRSAPVPSGNLELPYACGAIQRRDNWLFAVRGRSLYIPSRSFGDEFAVLYNCGSYEIQYPSKKVGDKLQDNNGRSPELAGWDYRKFPGMTMVQLPLKQISKKHDLYDDRIFSDQRMVGAVSSQSGNGAFVYSHHGPIQLGLNSFYAFKTYFFFGDKIVCLGTGIENTVADYSTFTTLFQNYLPGKVESDLPPTVMNDERILLLDETPVDSNSASWVLSSRGNAYYVPSGQELFVRRYNQSSMRKGKDNFANFECVWLDHGKAPRNASYRYFIDIKSSAEKIDRFANAMESKTPPFKILRQDNWIHAVTCLQTGETGLILTKRDYDLKIAGIKGVSRACALWKKVTPDGMELSVADPDLRFTGNSVFSESRASKIKVILNGRWKLKGYNKNAEILKSRSGVTVIEFTCKDGMSNKVKLVK